MSSNPRHSLPPRLMAHQPTRFATAPESTPSPSPCHLSDFLARWTFLCLKGIRRAWGGLRMGGIATVAAAIGADLAARLPRQNKKQREGLALLVATALDVRGVNLMDLAAALPRAAERLDMRYQWISRLLGNALIDTDAVMAPFAREVLARAGADGRTLVLIIDQSQVNAAHQMVMVSLRVGGRAVPLAWRVKETQGSVGFVEQRAALDRVAALLPEGVRPVLLGDRFYGSPALIAWCRAQGWDWRLRLKQDLLVFEDGSETTLAACFARGEHLLSDIELTETRVRTNIAMVHEAGHPEPWPRAVDHCPLAATVRPPGLRLWPALGHRGDVLGLQDARLWAGGQPDYAHRSAGPARAGAVAGPPLGGVDRHVGCGREPDACRKKTAGAQRRNVARSLMSLFTRGLRRLRLCLQRLIAPPPLWAAWKSDG